MTGAPPFRWRDELTGLLWISPWLIGAVAFLLVPMGLSLYYSFTDYNLLEPPLWVGLHNYTRMPGDPEFVLSLRNTLKYTLITIPLFTAIALLLSVMLNQRVRGLAFYRAAVFLPTLVPMVAGVMAWMWLFNGEHGLVNRVLALVGIDGPAWLLERDWAFTAVVIIGAWGVGQMVVVYLAALQDVPPQLYEAADLDGMGPVRKLWNVTIPMLSPVILFNTITLTIGSMQVFLVPYVLFEQARIKGGPDQTAYFYTFYMFDNAFLYGKMGYASAMAWVQLLIILALTTVLFAAGRRLVFYRGA